ncbi:MAG: ATP-dependent DNA ligase [Thermoflavifilum aggregans]|nr:ATP-dependent DNA ligase [Thermoflavifilum aggregans]
MKDLIALIRRLDQTQKTLEKLEALKHYFQTADPRDAIWTLALFAGRRPRRPIHSTQLKNWCKTYLQMPDWLFDECYQTVGDLAETIALLIPDGDALPDALPPLHQIMQQLQQLHGASEAEKQQFLITCWQTFDQTGRFVMHKLLTGAFRVGVSQNLVVQAIAEVYGLEKSTVAHRISGQWDPSQTRLDVLLHHAHENSSRPYPFCLAYPLEQEPESLGQPEAWTAEWKWDGIRGQLIRRKGETFLWSRGEELISDRFPELITAASHLSDGTVLDGEILPCRDTQILPFQQLQTRIGRKRVTPQLMQQIPIIFMAYDLLEFQGADLRNLPFAERRRLLEACIQQISHPQLCLSPLVPFADWKDLSLARQHAREMGSEGLMLKKKDSIYRTGRHKGEWWKWKVNPFSLDAVMLYAQRGHGRRASLYTDYTFALRDGDQLVPFVRAYSGLTDEEIREVDRFIKTHSREQFGPVKTVEPLLVFEIAFEGVAPSRRHRSGVAVRFPRILRWRRDKKPDEINTLDDLKELLRQYGS